MTCIPILTLYPDDAHVVQNPVRLGPGANNDSIGSDSWNESYYKKVGEHSVEEYPTFGPKLKNS